MQETSWTIRGNRVDIKRKAIEYAELTITAGIIRELQILQDFPNPEALFLLPGFIDSHVHIESSMLVPSEFARLAVVHGTVATISDPHEIANVCGISGVDFMIANGQQVPFKFHFGAPSCVPATTFETAGAALNSRDVEELLMRKDIYYLSEMMNFPGVLNGDEEVMKKIAAAHRLGKPVDGHAPGLRGKEAAQYIAAGISTDHECFTKEEALGKLQQGMKIIIREGSAAKNFDALIGLLQDYPEQIMFCSDDKHPDSLVEGHINQLCARAIQQGVPLFHVLQAACVNPVHHYGMRVGLLEKGHPADLIVVHDLIDFKVGATYIEGVLVASQGKSMITSVAIPALEQPFCSVNILPEQLSLRCNDFPADAEGHIPVIGALDGQLITHRLSMVGKTLDDCYVSDIEKDLLKIVVVNRYRPAAPAIAWVHGFGFHTGAIASTVAHDSHNIVAVGVDDESLAAAIQLVAAGRGGVSCVRGTGEKEQLLLPLPVGGLMSTADGYQIASDYTAIDQMAKEMGSQLSAPFMTLSFMALLVIPHVKLSDLGLFDGDKFTFLTRTNNSN
ncbi:MAG: adenine deaminase [Chitinophagaceae bacterium]|nr:adenine deaminase [Chitinophagaceae bacterium]